MQQKKKKDYPFPPLWQMLCATAGITSYALLGLILISGNNHLIVSFWWLLLPLTVGMVGVVGLMLWYRRRRRQHAWFDEERARRLMGDRMR